MGKRAAKAKGKAAAVKIEGGRDVPAETSSTSPGEAAGLNAEYNLKLLEAYNIFMAIPEFSGICGMLGGEGLNKFGKQQFDFDMSTKE